jgi:hypothetical protein
MKIRLLGLAAGLSVVVGASHLGVPPASANSFTFTYTGANYTGYGATNLARYGLNNFPFTQDDINTWARNLLPRLNITVTIDFIFSDMPDVTGTFLLNGFENRGGASDHSNDYVGNLTFSSGTANSIEGSFSHFSDSITLQCCPVQRG